MAYRRTEQVQARLDAQRARIIDAATEIVGEQGYAGCSMVAVSNRAGVASGTVYNHFAGKSDLVAEVFRTVVSREVDAVRASVRPQDSAAERTVALIETFSSRALKAPRLAYALLAEPVDPVVDALRLEFRVAFRDIAAESIAIGVASGELPPQNASVVAAALVGAIGEALVGPLASPVDGSPGAAADPSTIPTLVTFALRSLGISSWGIPSWGIPSWGISDGDQRSLPNHRD